MAKGLGTRRAIEAIALVVCLGARMPSLLAAAPEGRFLAKEDIILYGVGLTVAPAEQTVPKDIATIVSTFLQAPTLPPNLPPFAPDAEVRATLAGPSFATPRELVARPNSPFEIPPLSVPGLHSLENIRLVSGGEVLLYATPQNTKIDVIERLLVTQVTARPLSAAEIRENGIVFDRDSFQAYNFSAAFAVEDRKVNLSFPVLLPRLEGAKDERNDLVRLSLIPPVQPPTLRTIIPDTLKLQAQIPNLTVVGFTLSAPALKGQALIVPPIPGVVVIPGDIGFLNQFFSVMLMVGNVAPAGSDLVVSDLTAEIVLPPGQDSVVGSGDDPLRMARKAEGESPRIRAVVQPGLDARLGTADDVVTIGPGESGNAEYLVEGRREGSHVVEMQLSGTLNGLPVGPVAITGRAAGSVLVRNPKFTLTFTHPEVISAGEPYTLDVTITNTSLSPANFVTMSLYPHNVSGAEIIGDPTRSVESIPAGDSASVTFDLIARTTGKVTAATLDSDENVSGRFALKTAVGELGVPLSPDSLILPSEAAPLDATLRQAAIGLLGKAWAVATAPAAALPRDLRRFSKKIVLDRAVEVAEAGLRVTLHEPPADSAAQLAMDVMGSNYPRLGELVKPEELAIEQDNFVGFDELRRRSVRGDVFARAVAALLADNLAQHGAVDFHASLAQKWSYRPAHLAVLLSGGSGPSPYRLVVLDAQGRALGGTSGQGKVVKEIPFADLLPFTDAGGMPTADLAVIAAPEVGPLTVRLVRQADAAPTAAATLSLVLPAVDGSLRQVVYDLSGGQAPEAITGGPHPVSFEIVVDGQAQSLPAVPAASSATVPDPAPSVISVVQQKNADVIRCGALSVPAGRVVAVLFTEEVTPASVQDRRPPQDITAFLPEANRAVGVALQPGRRIAFVALRDGVGPFVPRSLAVQDVMDRRGQAMAPFTGPIEMTVSNEGAVVSGRVLEADGTPVAFPDVRLFYFCKGWIGISSKSADENGRYSWDYVVKPLADRVLAVKTDTEEFRGVEFNVQRNGQQINVDIVFIGRGAIRGVARSEEGVPLPDTEVRVLSFTDQSQYGARTDDGGRFEISGVPVGNLFLEAVNVQAKAQTAVSDFIPLAGSVIERDLTLFDVEQRKITVKHGTVRGHVYRADGVTPVDGVPVYVAYESDSQPGVKCPTGPDPCPIAAGTTDATGAFELVDVTAGRLTVSSFDQSGLSQGVVGLVLPADGQRDVHIRLAGGLGTVEGRVLDADGTPVAGAEVGGGLSLTTTNAEGHFTLADVPVGEREIVANSRALSASGRVTVDIIRPGEVVGATIVFGARGAIAGVVRRADGVTPVPDNKVYAFRKAVKGYQIIGQATTDGLGRYRIENVPPDTWTVSAFVPGFTDGNLAKAVVKTHGQTAKADVRFRGGSGSVTGRVLDDDGQTPLKARVGVSGERLRVAGGLVGVLFEHVANFAIVDTDLEAGRFRFNGLFVGPFTISAAGQFSPDPVAVEGTIPAPNASVQLDVRLQATSQIRGTVFQSDEVTPAGADVVVKYKSEEFKVVCTETAGDAECVSIPQGVQEETVVTDAAGRFWLPVVNAGLFSLTAFDSRSGKVGQVRGSVRPGETGEIPVRLIGRASLNVTVLGSDRTTRIAGAKVVVEHLGYPAKSVTRFAGPDGVASFVGADDFPEGELVIEATDAGGFAGRAAARIEKDGQAVAKEVFLFNSAGAVHGTILQSDGVTPIANAEVVVGNSLGPLAVTVTDTEGHYAVGVIPLGEFDVEAFDPRSGRRGAGEGRIDIDDQDVPVNVVVTAIGMVKGAVLEAGPRTPLKAWSVLLQQTSPAGISLPSLATTTGVDGRFAIPGAARGTFTVLARHLALAGSAQASGELEREGQVVDVPLLVTIDRPLSGTISGTVVGPTGAPLAHTNVEICPGVCRQPPLLVTSDENGTFAVEGLPLGRFTVHVRSQTTREAGSAVGDLLTDEDVASVTVVMQSVAVIDGRVEYADGTAAVGAEVVLDGLPQTGCGQPGLPSHPCSAFTLSDGRFHFPDQPTRSFTVTAVDALNPLLKGAAGGSVNPGQTVELRIVLAPSAPLSGRVLRSSGAPAGAVLAELIYFEGAVDEKRFYKETRADGTFLFAAAPIAAFKLQFTDSAGAGEATRTGHLTGPLALGDTVLDEAAPAVARLTPLASSTGVPLDQAFTIVFTEPVKPGTIGAQTVALTGPAGPVLATRDLSSNDTTVTVRPLQPLKDEARYTLRIGGVKDRVDKVMVADHTASFTTVDITPPSIVSTAPAAGTAGAPPSSPIRITYSETIDPSKFSAPPIALAGPAGAVTGRTDYLLGNTVIVFTPNLPLVEGSTYQVQVAAARDLAGLLQPSGFSYPFTTTDRTRPELAGLVAAGDGTVIENGTTTVTANAGATHDVLFVDFYLNGQLALVDRTAPFAITFQALPTLGAPGGRVTVSALATDTSGNRGLTPAAIDVPIVADQPPALAITAPAPNLAAPNGARIVVDVRATDDLGVKEIGYRARTGQPGAALTRVVAPPALDRTESFAFYIPTDAEPGTAIPIEASAADTKGQVAAATPITVTVLDATPPAVTITGATTGAQVAPGQRTTVVVTATDVGRIASIRFTASGLVTASETRPLQPPLKSAVTSFTVTVPATAQPNQTLILDASATDVAGNTTDAARVILPVADAQKPTITLVPESGVPTAVPGRPVRVIATANDEIAVQRIDLTASGAVTFADSKQTPLQGSVTAVFEIPVPASATPGATIDVRATAVDRSSNVSTPALLSLTVNSSIAVSLPESAIVDAGQTLDVTVQLGEPASAGGLLLSFTSTDPSVATVTPLVTFASGEMTKTIAITGVAGGTVQVAARQDTVERATMTVTVQGGFVSGIVRDSQLSPVAGAEVTVTSGSVAKSATTGADGRYVVSGVRGLDVSVRALDPVTRLYGHSTARMAHLFGVAAVNVVLIPAGSIHGQVLEPDGLTSAGAGVQVRILPSGSSTPVPPRFTDETGAYEFPLVTLGSYTLEASTESGRRGRTSVSLTESGQQVTAPIVFLGWGTVSGVVRMSGAPVPNASLRFDSWSLFGNATPILTQAQPDGSFTFPNVPIGSFTVTAKNATGQGGSASGQITQHLQPLTADIALSTYGAVEGTVYRPTETGPVIVAGALVRITGAGYSAQLPTDSSGRYRFDVVPVASFTLTATDDGTQARGTAQAVVSAPGQTATRDVTFLPQGRLLVTVTTANGQGVPSAFVNARVTTPGAQQSQNATTGAGGAVLLEHVNAGAFEVSATSGPLRGLTAGTLAAFALLPVTVALEPTGSIAGTVFAPDGQTPVKGARVTVTGQGVRDTAEDGTFRFDGVRLGRYEVTVADSAGRLRAHTNFSDPADDLVLTALGQEVTRELTMIGLGSVYGFVVGDGASGMPVSVRALAPGFETTRGATTGGAGEYRVENVPVGPIFVTASNTAQQRYGEFSGTLPAHGADLRADIVLTNNAITLPRNVYDANNSFFDVQPDAAVDTGSQSVFIGGFSSERGAFLLDVVAGGVATRFEGGEIPTIEDGGREIVARQENVAGLSVTRKVFVPRAGYFARYLELLRNPTSSPITVDLRVLSHLSGTGLAVERTSSGDVQIDVSDLATADRWVAFGRAQSPAPAVVFDGPGAAVRAAAVTLSMNASPAFGRFSCTWTTITIEPGGTAAILHFGVQQLSRAAAVASAERLAQLPPEALAGLSEEELAAVRNFALPAGGVSTIAPLPSLTGTVTGVVREADETTPVVSAPVRFKSAHPLFGGTFGTTSNAGGAFTFAGQLNDFGSSRAIPVDAFTLEATYPSTSNVISPGVPGSFPAGATTAVADVTFSNTGAVFGDVSRHTGTAVGGGSIQLTRGQETRSVGIQAASYRVGGLLPGTYAITASIPNPGGAGGTGLVGHATAVVTAGPPQRVDVEIDPTGTLRGVVRRAGVGGAVVTNRQVVVQRSAFVRSVNTDSGGAYNFADLPTGTFTVSVSEPSIGTVASAPVTIATDETTVQHLTLVPLAPVTVQVRYQNDAVAAGASLTLTYTTLTGQAQWSGTTNSGGVFTFDKVMGGPFTVLARHPRNGTFTAQAVGEITQDDLPVPVTITLPALGSVQVQVNRGAAVPVANSSVRLEQAGRAAQFATSAANGRATFNVVPAGAFTVRATHPENTSLTVTGAGTVSSEGEVAEVTVTLPPIGSVTGTVTLPDHSLVAGVVVTLRSANPAIGVKTATTNAQGVYLVSGVPEGSFTVSVDDLSRGFGSSSGQVTTDGAAVTTNIVLIGTTVDLPMDLFDGNAFRFDIQQNGSILDGSENAYDSGFRLRLYTAAGAQVQFPSTATGRTEDAGREVAIKRAGLAGLEVTRKVYVPVDGYFARYLEVLTNTGTGPVTVDAEITTDLGSNNSTQVVATSSGDDAFAADDRWIVTDDADGSGTPTLAHVMAGSGASRAVSSATRSGDDLFYRWNGITVGPGQTVILMHFASQEFDRQKSSYVAERLVQLPPEATFGLSADEIAGIANFAVPADGSSPLAEMRRPPAATVSGRVFGSDGQAPVAGAAVTLRSENPIFGVPLTGTSAADGGYTFGNALLDAFSATAQHPHSMVVAPPVAGTFAAGQTAATADVVFSNTGTIRGVVRRNTGQPVASGHIVAPYAAPLAADGSYVLTGLTGDTDVEVSLSGSLGLSQRASVTVTIGQTSIADFRLPPLGSVEGTVRTAANVPAAGVTVRLGDASSFMAETVTDAAGHYAFTDVFTEPTTVSAREPQTGTWSTVPAAIVEDQTITVDLVLPAVATVRVHVRDASGNPRPNAEVGLRRSSDTFFSFAGITGAGGFVDVPRVAEGAFVARSPYPGFGYSHRSGVVTPANHGQVVEVVVVAPLEGSVQGHVYAADGTTPLPGIQVNVVDAATGTGLVADVTDESGHYRTSSLLAGGDGFVVRAWNPTGNGSVERTGHFTPPSQLFTADFTLPLSVVRGTVTNADGAPVPWPNVFVTQYSAQDGDRAYFPWWRDSNGQYLVLGVPVGTFEVTAQDDVGVTATVPGDLVDPASPVVVDVTLPATGFVGGVVRNADGTPAAGAQVRLAGAGLGGALATAADQDGFYAFPRVPLGPVSVQACLSDGGRVCATVSGVVDEDSFDLALPGTGTVVVRVIGYDSQPLTTASLSFEGVSLPLTFSDVPLDGQEAVTVVLPEGTVRIVANDEATGAFGAMEATLLAGQTLPIDVYLGSASSPGIAFSGDDGFRYDIQCDGRLGEGGRWDGTVQNAYDSAYGLRLNGDDMPCVRAFVFEGWNYVAGPVAFDGGGLALPFAVARKFFVPGTGGYARYLDVVTNTTSVTHTATLRVHGDYGPDAARVEVPVTPGQTGNTYAVMQERPGDSPDGLSAPVVAHVVAGPGAPVGIRAARVVSDADEFWYEWRLTLAPGQSAAVLHFTIQRAPGDVAGAEAQAQALVDLSDPSALEGLSPYDRGLIVNFASVPGGQQASTGTVEGMIAAEDTGTPLEGARVYALDLATGRLLRSSRTGSDGLFVLPSLYTTGSDVQIIVLAPGDPSISAQRIFTLDGGTAFFYITLPVPPGEVLP